MQIIIILCINNFKVIYSFGVWSTHIYRNVCGRWCSALEFGKYVPDRGSMKVGGRKGLLGITTTFELMEHTACAKWAQRQHED